MLMMVFFSEEKKNFWDLWVLLDAILNSVAIIIQTMHNMEPKWLPHYFIYYSARLEMKLIYFVLRPFGFA